MIFSSKIEQGIAFFGIDEKYKENCLRCGEEINQNPEWSKSFQKVFDFLNFGDVNVLKTVWDLNEMSQLFVEGIPPFVTNLMVVLGYETYQKNMEKAGFNQQQTEVHKQRIKSIFEQDYEIEKYGGIVFTNMSWAYYFIRMRVIEAGRLQYENFDGKCIKLHIPVTVPSGEKFEKSVVLKSLEASKEITEGMFHMKDAPYLCESWLLCRQIMEEGKKNSNLYEFYRLFDVTDGEDCLKDVLHYVFPGDNYDDYHALSENTRLQKMVKEKLLKGISFRLGMGTLVKERLL